MDIDTVKIIICKFAETYDFVQRKDIAEVESLKTFDKKNYLKLDNKPFVLIDEYKSIQRTEIVFGRIQVIMEDIDEEEWISFDNEIFFRFPLSDSSDPDTFNDCIVKECIKHGLLPHYTGS